MAVYNTFERYLSIEILKTDKSEDLNVESLLAKAKGKQNKLTFKKDFDSQHSLLILHDDLTLKDIELKEQYIISS